MADFLLKIFWVILVRNLKNEDLLLQTMEKNYIIFSWFLVWNIYYICVKIFYPLTNYSHENNTTSYNINKLMYGLFRH